MNEPTMEEMIEACEKKKTDDEIIAFGLGAGRIVPVMGKSKIMKKTFKYIKEMDGFIGVHPIDIWHTLLVFDTLNHAKGARNDLKGKGVPVGQVVPILIPKEFKKT